MTSVQKQIHKHRSIRKYSDRAVPEPLLNRILEAGTRASSSGNMQAYSIIVTRDQKMKRKMLSAHFNQSMILEAPVFLTFCADFHRMRKWLKLSHAPENFDNFMSFMIATIDATLVSQNVSLAAESEGLGICYMGTTLASCAEIAQILECPDHVVPVVGFSLGFPAEEPEERKRLPLAGIVHDETYRKDSDQDILKIYRERESSGMKRYQSDNRLRKLIQKHKVKNLGQVYTKVKYTRESHIKYSNSVLNCLKAKGFL